MSRRGMLAQCANGFGAVALAALHADPAFANDVALKSSPIQAGHGPHHTVRAKNVIFLYMDGGPSQVDTFDPKPLLYHPPRNQALCRIDASWFIFGLKPIEFLYVLRFITD